MPMLSGGIDPPESENCTPRKLLATTCGNKGLTDEPAEKDLAAKGASDSAAGTEGGWRSKRGISRRCVSRAVVAKVLLGVRPSRAMICSTVSVMPPPPVQGISDLAPVGHSCDSIVVVAVLAEIRGACTDSRGARGVATA